LEEEKMWAKRKNHAVSEIIGTVMLLGIAIAMFSLVQLFAFGLLSENPNSPSVRLVASVEDSNIIIVHNGGESLPLNTRILYTINGTPQDPFNAGDSIIENDPKNNLWGIGEIVKYNSEKDLESSNVEILVVDVKSNSVIMRTIIQEE